MFFKHLRSDIDSMMARDPAARSRLEVVLCYPGFHALFFYRLGHAAWSRGFLLLGRWLTQIGRWLTGIEIHPGAQIGRRFFIDHGMGVVIGETAVIGDDVTLYQGVTLGGTSLKGGKRHPTLSNKVIVGAGAQVLGPITVGEGARVGANAVVLKDVPPGATMVGIPARAVVDRDAAVIELAQRATYDSGAPRNQPPAPDDCFYAYGTPSADLPDPVARAIDGLAEQVTALRRRLEEVERETATRESDERNKALHR
ncbi:MAG TPA: serine O-acetyltransferase [Alphaproteobacteria bacterium]|nr:serine O-acetyltransferase [Alphaproteobacteria bacterium]